MIQLLHDLKRVVSLSEDLLYLAGRSLQRRALRNGIVIAVGYGSALFGVKVAGYEVVTQKQVLSLLAASFASYPLGTVCVRLADLLTRGNLDAAAAGHLHLTSHYKRLFTNLHLSRL